MRREEENEEENEERLGERGGSASDAGEAEDGRDDGDDEEERRVVEHGRRGLEVQDERDERNKPVRAATMATTPPIMSQMVLSVGAPVKKREKAEPMESEAWRP